MYNKYLQLFTVIIFDIFNFIYFFFFFFFFCFCNNSMRFYLKVSGETFLTFL
jgi:hypothetical protein